MKQAPGTAPQQELRASTLQRLARRLSPPVAAQVVFAVGLAVTLLAYALTSSYVEKQARQRFDSRAASAFSQIGKRLDDYRNVILGLQSAFIASKDIDRGEFHRYSENLQLKQRVPGLQALSFQRYVRHADKAAFIAAVRRDRSLQPQGYPDFTIRPEGERPDYLVIDYIEPMQANLAAFGHDAATQQAQADAIRLARDSGQFQVSPPFTIAQSPAGAPRLVMRAPVYRNGAGAHSVEQRRAALQGFVVLTFDPQASFRDFFSSLAMEGERIVIEDAGLAMPSASSQRQLIFDSSAESRKERILFSQSASLEFGGRNWDIRFIGDNDAWLPRQPGRHHPAVVFSAGLVISLLLAALALSQARARDEALRLARGMTAELRRSAERLRAASELSSEWYWEQDAAFRFTDIVGRAHQTAGLDFERIMGKTRWETSPAALSPEEWEAHHAALEAHQPFTIAYRFLGADGMERWIEIKGLPRLDENGGFVGYHGTGRDVTERVRTIAALKKQATVLQTTLDHMNQGISVVDSDLRLIGYNHRFLDLLKLPESLIREDTGFEDVIRYNAGRGEYGPGDIEEQVRSRVELAHRFLPHRFKRTRPDGTVIEILGTPLPGGGMVTTYTDITLQERAQEALRHSEARYRTLVELSPDAVFVHRNRVILLANAAAARLFRAESPQALVGRNIAELVAPQDLEGVEMRIGSLESAATAFVSPRETRYLALDGSIVEVESSGACIDLDGQAAVLTAARDISERKRAEEAFQRQSAVLQTTIENLEQGVSVIDADLHLSAMNRRFCELLDLPEDMIRGGIPVEEIFRYNALRGEYGPGDVEQMVQERLELARRFEPHRFKRTRPNGRIIEVRGSPIAGGGFVTSYTDITEREHAEEALRLSEQRYRDLVELSSDWHWEQDAQFRFTHMSGGAFNKGKFRVAESIGKTRWELSIEGVGAAEWADHRALLERHDPFVDFTYWIRTPDGELRWYAVSGRPVFGENGEFQGYHGVGRDITEERHAEQRIRELNETLEQRVRERTAELEASNQELESFSYSVSHDLRAPLRALHGFSHLLTEEYSHRLDENGLHYLSRIRAASQHMGDLIDNLLDLARVSRQELNRAQVNLSALAGEILAELREQQPQRAVSWSIAPNLVAHADPVLMKALLDNLLRNAWKFTAEKEGAHIEFSASMVDGRQAFRVRDNGAGFEMAYADKLFKPFQRLHNVKRFEGTGIGLAIVQRIVRRHGGRVWAEGTPGQGAAFWFTLS